MDLSTIHFVALVLALVVFIAWKGSDKKRGAIERKKKTDGDDTNRTAKGHAAPNQYEHLRQRLSGGKHDVKSICVALRRAFERNLGGAILIRVDAAKSSGRALAIEFDSPRGDDGIEVEFVVAPDEGRAKKFLRDETFEAVSLSVDAFEEFRRYILSKSHSKGGQVDIGSGCAIYEGYIAPPS